MLTPLPPTSAATLRRAALARVSRALLFTVLGLLALSAVLLLGLGILNSFDQHELPATRAALGAPINPTADAQNLYLAIAGFNAAAGQSLTDAGKVRIARYDQAIDSQQSVNHILAAANGGDSNGGVDPGSAIACDPIDSPLWSDAKSHAAEFEAARDANHDAFARYTSLHGYSNYYETARPSNLAPLVRVPRSVRCLYLAATAAALQSHDARRQLDAAATLAQDLSLWRTVLVGDGTVLSKMLAATELHGDLMLAAAAVADPAVSPTQLEMLQLQPFDLKDWQLTTALAAEFRAVAYIYRQLLPRPVSQTDPVRDAKPPSSGWWQKLLAAYNGRFFKYNATLNLGAAELHELSRTTQTDPAHYEAARAAFETWSNDHIKVNSWRSLYNPTGRVLVAMSSGSSDYQMRAYDYATFQRLVFLAYQIRQQGAACAEVRSFMATHPEWSTHPVSGKFFAWDAAARQLSMTPVVKPTNTAGIDLKRRYTVSALCR